MEDMSKKMVYLTAIAIDATLVYIRALCTGFQARSVTRAIDVRFSRIGDLYPAALETRDYIVSLLSSSYSSRFARWAVRMSYHEESTFSE